MEVTDLNGKTIKSATQMKHKNHDDEGWIRLEFSDGTCCDICATYGGYTGESKDEYRTLIHIAECCDYLVPLTTKK